jgi:alpha-galactosidase
MIKRVELIKENNLPYEYFWIDAGWYGMTKPTLNEYQGDWARHTGDWRISPYTHPNGLKDVSKAVHDAGMKLLLWFEFEQVFETVPMLQEHPEWFLGGGWQKFLNLGNPEAYEYELNTLRTFIKDLHLDCYRQDFNGKPLEAWRENDASDRQGITEIKHINNLYKLYDTILEEFPHLIIDNCSSGGRRIDIEMMRRSIPLWRTDYYCPANFDTEVQQMHQQLYSMWLPYHGACIKTNDEYVIRGGYSTCSGSNLLYYGDTADYNIETQKKYLPEYLRVRPYFSQNFYALTEPSKNRDVWCASQYHNPDTDEGMIQVFKREFSSYDTATFNLKEIDENATYTFEDIDEGTTEISGADLKNLTLTIKEKRNAKIYIYKKK